MKRIIRILVVILSFLLCGFAQQQNDRIEVKRMQVKIWPEYDKQEVLIINRLQLSDDTTLPIQLSFRIPREAGSPYKVAMIDEDGVLYNLEYTLIPEGVWNRVVFTTSSTELQIEYYDPRLTFVEDERSFSYSWIGDYRVEVLQVSIQQPRDAENMTISPDIGAGVVNPDDKLTYFTTIIGKVETGITFNLDIHYTKTTNSLSASNLPVVAATPITNSGGFGQDILDVMDPVFDNRNLVTAGAMIIGSLILFTAVSVIAGDKILGIGKLVGKTIRIKESSQEKQEMDAYCPHCGKKKSPGERFCRACGTPLD